jgi:hypothetical protein
VQERTLNKATDEVLLACNMAQLIETELSGAATEKGKNSVITKAVFCVLRNNASNSS